MESCNHNHLQSVLFGTTHSSPICPTIVGDMLGKSLWDNTLFSQLSYHCWRHVRKFSFGQHTLLPVVLPLLETCQENLFGTTHSFFSGPAIVLRQVSKVSLAVEYSWTVVFHISSSILISRIFKLRNNHKSQAMPLE